MFLLLPISLIILLNCLLFIDANPINEISREWIFEKRFGQMIEDPVIIGENNEFAYAQCKNLKESGGTIARNCKITYEYYNADGSVYKNKCFFDLRSRNSKKVLLGAVMLSTLNNRVAFLYIDPLEKMHKQHMIADLYIRLVNMLTCEYSETKILLNTTFGYDITEMIRNDIMLKPRVFQYSDGSYDIFTLDEDLCNAGRCKYFVDFEGRMQEGEVVPYLSKKYSLNRVMMYPTFKRNSYFAVITNYTGSNMDNPVVFYDELTIVLARPYARYDTVLLQLTRGRRLCDIDSTDGQLTICYTSTIRENTAAVSVYCKRFDSTGKEIINESFLVPHRIKTLKIKSISTDEFILLTEDCEKNKCDEKTRFFLKNIKIGDDYSQTMVIDSFYACNQTLSATVEARNKITSISIDDDRNVCVSVAAKCFEDFMLMDWQLMRKCTSGLLKVEDVDYES